MFAFALFATACAHDASPDDIHRFGFYHESSDVSHVHRVWVTTSRDRERAEELTKYYRFHGMAVEWAEVVMHYKYRERCWGHLDSLACSDSIEWRWQACQLLREDIGVVPYYLGEMPE